MPQLLRSAFVAVALLLALPAIALAGVQPGQPFPTNLDTTIDLTQLTGLRVALPKPDCATHPSDCSDIDVLNSLDGFNVDARVSIPFSGPIDLSTVTPDTVFLVDAHGHRTTARPARLDRRDEHAPRRAAHVSRPAHAVSSSSSPTASRPPTGSSSTRRASVRACRSRRAPVSATRSTGSPCVGALALVARVAGHIADASLFTTQSITSLLEKVRRQIDRSHPAPATFTIGSAGERAVFPFSSVVGENFHRQTGTATFSDSLLPRGGERVPGRDRHGRVRQLHSPDYENSLAGHSRRRHRASACRRCRAPTRSTSTSGCRPARSRRAAGPSRSSGTASPTRSRASRSRPRRRSRKNGIATIAINVVGHGGGPLGTITVAPQRRRAGDVLAGGRGYRPGRQRHDRLDRGRQRGAAVRRRRQSRRPPPDRDRPDAARRGRSRSAST